MKQVFYKIAWTALCVIPVLFWHDIYQSTVTEYDKNIAHFIGALLTSFLTVALLIAVRKDFKKYIKVKLVIRGIVVLFASPLTVGLIIMYHMTIPMHFKWSTSSVTAGKSYSTVKYRNYFKAENFLILNDLSTNPDSLKSVIKRNGDLVQLYKLKGEREIEISVSLLDSLPEKQSNELLVY